MAKYFVLLAISVFLVSCDRNPLLQCDPAPPSYEPIYLRVVDNNTGADLLGSASYDLGQIVAKQNCTTEESETVIVKGLISGSTDSIPLLRVILANGFNGNTCNDFFVKWNDLNSNSFTVAFRDSVPGVDACDPHYYIQSLNDENGNAVTRLNNMITDSRYFDNNGRNVYYVIRK